MLGFATLLLYSLAVSHGQFLVVDSSLMEKLRPRLPKLLQELTNCPACAGFWIALVLAKLAIVDTLAIGFLGLVLYNLREKYLPCTKCKNNTNLSEWKVS